MSSVPVGAIVLVGVIVLLIVLGVVLRVLFAAIGKRADAARERFPDAIIVAGANFFGQESRGRSQVRGNGTLVLTEAELYFEQLLPRREFHIPISRMQAVDTPRSHWARASGAGWSESCSATTRVTWTRLRGTSETSTTSCERWSPHSASSRGAAACAG